MIPAGGGCCRGSGTAGCAAPLASTSFPGRARPAASRHTNGLFLWCVMVLVPADG